MNMLLAAVDGGADVNSAAMQLTIRVVHLLAAMALAGAVFFQRFALQPSLATLDESSRAGLRGAIAARWRSIAFLAMAALLLTGLVNFLLYKIPELKPHPSKGIYHALFGAKFLLALIAFHSATVLVLPGEKGERYRAGARGRLTFLSLIVVLIIVVGSVLRYFDALFPAARTAAA